ncbi:MAG TPA: glucose 1-dehydrogenase [Nitrolancea sp.]|nr:glucose 1-dehydrogenase [Nitrolancea sp.]
MAGRLEGKVAVITGAASGIGLATARLFVAEGARVVMGDINAERLAEASKSVDASGELAFGHTVDVSASEQVASLIDATISRFGSLDVMFSNAGISGRNNVVDLPEELFDRIIAVNLRGGFLCAKYAIPHMLAGGGGSLIFTASELALVAAENSAAYCASKTALIGMARAIAVDHATQGIRVNCLCPGPVDTPLLHGNRPNREEHARSIIERMPVKRIGHVDELARAALFLASDDSSFMTGTALVVDGGVTALW